MPPRPLHRLALLLAAVIAVALSCGREPTAAGGGAVRYARGFSFRPVFPAILEQAGGAGAGLAAFTSVHVVLRHSDGTIALDTVIAFPPGTDTLTVHLPVALLPGAPATGEAMTLDVSYLDAAGATVYKSDPLTVTVPPSVPGEPAPPAVPVKMNYTGPGSSAARVRIAPRGGTVFLNETFTFTAAAQDAAGVTIPNTPVVWTSLDPAVASMQSATAGTVVAHGARGTARIVATLLTSPADTVTLSVVPHPSALAIESGSGQTGIAGTALAQPLVARVSAPDGLGVGGIVVSFAPAALSGSVGATSVTTDAGGLARTSWTLGAFVGAQSVTASAAGLTGSPLTFSATAILGPPTKLVVAAQPASTTTGATLGDVAFTVRDANDNLVTTFTGSVTVAFGKNPGGATLGGTTTVTADAGVATFSTLSVDQVGTGYTLVASSSGLASATTAPFNITLGIPVKVGFTGQPSSAKFGAKLGAVVVSALDEHGNVTPSFTGAVTVALGANPLGATLGGTTTVTAVAGVATFSGLSVSKVATGYTLVASSSGLASATSTPFDIFAGLAVKLAFTSQPGNATSGTSLGTVSVAAQDAQGDLTPAFTDAVKLTLSAPTAGALAVLGGTTTVNAVNGVATFSNLTVKGPAATYALVATTATLFGATSQPFAITNGQATNLVLVSGGGQVATMGAVLAPIVVKVTDQAGDPIADSTVTFSVTTGGGSVTPVSGKSGAAGTVTTTWTLGSPVGAQTITATSTGLPPLVISATALALQATQLAFMVAPSATIAGASIVPAIVVEARDETNTRASAYAGNVTLALGANPGASTLSGTRTVAAVAGVATFSNISLNHAGTGYTLVASAADLASATSPAFTISPPGPTTLAITAGNGQTGTVSTVLPTTLSVKVTDAFANGVSGVSVAWAVATGGGSVSAATSVTNASGIATVTWTLGPASGAQSVTATVSGLSGSPATFTATAGNTRVDYTWTGATDTLWTTASNWSPAGVPAANDSVYIPSSGREPAITTSVSVKHLVIAACAYIDNFDTLTVSGHLIDYTSGCMRAAPSASRAAASRAAAASPLRRPTVANAVEHGGAIILTGTGNLRGTFTGPVEITGGVHTLVGSTVVDGSLTVSGTGRLDLGGNSINASGTFATAGSGTLKMQNALDDLTISGDADFSGGSETGLLTAGMITAQSNFSQTGTGSFVAGVNHTTRFVTTSGVTTFDDPNSAFGQLVVAGYNDLRGSVNVLGDVVVDTNSTLLWNGEVGTPGRIKVSGNVIGRSGSLLQTKVVELTAGVLSDTGTFTPDTVIFSGGTGPSPQVIHSTVAGGWSNISYNTIVVTGNARMVSDTMYSLSASLIVRGSGVLRLGNVVGNRAWVSVGNELITAGSGVLRMNDASIDTWVRVGGAVTFGGGSTTGLLTTGILNFGGDFTQSGSSTSFAPSGTLMAVDTGSVTGNITFANPSTSAFQDLTIASGRTVALNSDVVVLGTLTHGPGTSAAALSAAATKRITVSGLDNPGTYPMNFSNVLLKFVDGTASATFNNVNWSGFASGFTGSVFEVARTTGTLTFSSLNFGLPGFTASASAHFILNSGGAALTISSSTPASGTLGTHYLNSGAGSVSWP